MKSKLDKTSPAAAHILLVDDNSDGLSARRMVLAELGYEISTAQCAERALQILEYSNFQVMVTDYRMPGGANGIELIQKVREQKPGIRIILISGFVDAMGLTEANTGADCVIMKSSNEVTQLLRAIARLSKRAPGKAGSDPRRSGRSKGAGAP